MSEKTVYVVVRSEDKDNIDIQSHYVLGVCGTIDLAIEFCKKDIKAFLETHWKEMGQICKNNIFNDDLIDIVITSPDEEMGQQIRVIFYGDISWFEYEVHCTEMEKESDVELERKEGDDYLRYDLYLD